MPVLVEKIVVEEVVGCFYIISSLLLLATILISSDRDMINFLRSERKRVTKRVDLLKYKNYFGIKCFLW